MPQPFGWFVFIMPSIPFVHGVFLSLSPFVFLPSPAMAHVYSRGCRSAHHLIHTLCNAPQMYPCSGGPPFSTYAENPSVEVIGHSLPVSSLLSFPSTREKGCVENQKIFVSLIHGNMSYGFRCHNRLRGYSKPFQGLEIDATGELMIRNVPIRSKALQRMQSFEAASHKDLEHYVRLKLILTSSCLLSHRRYLPRAMHRRELKGSPSLLPKKISCSEKIAGRTRNCMVSGFCWAKASYLSPSPLDASGSNT